jgi:hypothetical protein
MEEYFYSLPGSSGGQDALLLRLILTWWRKCSMAKPNYAFAKRQRDLAKKQKKEEKRLRKTGPVDPNETPPAEGQPQPPGDDKPVT